MTKGSTKPSIKHSLISNVQTVVMSEQQREESNRTFLQRARALLDEDAVTSSLVGCCCCWGCCCNENCLKTLHLLASVLTAEVIDELPAATLSRRSDMSIADVDLTALLFTMLLRLPVCICRQHTWGNCCNYCNLIVINYSLFM